MNTEIGFSPNNGTGIRTITLQRPGKANALSAELIEQLLACVEEACSDDTRVLVFKGSGKNFCAGFDFSGYTEQSEGDLLRRFVRLEELLQAIRYAPLVTIACVQGATFGAGADLLAACAYRLGISGARFRFPGFQFGVALGTRHLARIVGTSRARKILLNNELLDTTQALDCGLLTHLVETDDIDETVNGIIQGIGSLGRMAMKQLLSNTIEDTKDQDLAELVRSVSVPGLHERIEKYRSASGA